LRGMGTGDWGLGIGEICGKKAKVMPPNKKPE